MNEWEVVYSRRKIDQIPTPHQCKVVKEPNFIPNSCKSKRELCNAVLS